MLCRDHWEASPAERTALWQAGWRPWRPAHGLLRSLLNLMGTEHVKRRGDHYREQVLVRLPVPGMTVDELFEAVNQVTGLSDPNHNHYRSSVPLRGFREQEFWSVFQTWFHWDTPEIQAVVTNLLAATTQEEFQRRWEAELVLRKLHE